MVFGKPEHFNAKLITQLGFRDAFRDDAMITGRLAAFGEEEVAEAQHGGLHGGLRQRLDQAQRCASFFLAQCP